MDTQTESPAPLPCPNCDSDNLTSAFTLGEPPRFYRLQCKDCGHLGPERKSMKAAEKAWDNEAFLARWQ